MINGNLAYEYISDIPWDKNPAFAFSGDTQSYIKAFQNIIKVLPIGDMKISFNDNIWDFNTYIKDSNKSEYKFSFDDLPTEIQEYCKFFVLYGIMGKRKMSTIHVRFSNFKSVILSILHTTKHDSLYLITTEDIINEITHRNVAGSTAHNLYEAVYQTYDFVYKNYKLNLPVDLNIIKEHGIKQKNLSKKHQEENKIPNIPEEYFNAIFNTCLRVMRDSNENTTFRMTAAMIMILSQTGLRIGDLARLTTDSLHEKRLKKSGNTTHYIHYTAQKPSKAHAPLLEFDVFSNNYATEAFKLLLKLRKESIYSQKYNYLITFPSKYSKVGYPLSRTELNKKYHDFMYNYMRKEIFTEWENIRTIVYQRYNPDIKDTEMFKINVPESRQFRVHCCTSLYNQGVSLVYIQKYMSHLSEIMMGYYVRPPETYQENVKYTEQIIKEMEEEELTPLGGNLIGEDIRRSIHKFIEDNGFNVKTDISEIVKAMGDKVIVRGKTGGVCIKTSLMPCAKDARSNEMMCAYNYCPNLFHFYYMIDVTYLNFQTLQETYHAMLENGNTRAAQKELKKLKDVLKRRLIPELDELEKEISKKGFNKIIELHPSLIEIIENIDDIRKETELWMNHKTTE